LHDLDARGQFLSLQKARTRFQTSSGKPEMIVAVGAYSPDAGLQGFLTGTDDAHAYNYLCATSSLREYAQVGLKFSMANVIVTNETLTHSMNAQARKLYKNFEAVLDDAFLSPAEYAAREEKKKS